MDGVFAFREKSDDNDYAFVRVNAVTELEQRLTAEIAQLHEENRLLRQKLDLVIRQLFGKKSERLDPAQLELLLGDLDSGGDGGLGKDEASGAHEELLEAVPDKSRRRRKTGGRRVRVPEHLPIVETVIEPGAVKACPEAWRRIGEEVSVQLDYEPGRFLQRRTVRPKYVRHADRSAPPVIAELPPKLIEGGIATPGLLTEIIIGKYCDHLPLYRQEQIFDQRHGVGLPRQSMCRWVEAVADWLRPIYRNMHREMFAGDYVEVDETPVKFLQPGTGKAQQGYLWTYKVPGGDTLFDWHAGRSHKCLEPMVPGTFRGVIQSDGYGAYRTFARKRGDSIELAGCWAHARRKFFDALEAGDSGQRAAWVLRQLQQLYRIEEGLRESRAGPRQRQAMRSAVSRMILDRLWKALHRFKASGKHLPKSLMGRALNYALNQQAELSVFIDNGKVEIDNNLCENAIRPTAIGKKNWLFIGAKDAGWRSAVIYSIIGSCRSRGIDPHAYLKEVLTRLPTMTNWEVASITPRAWAESKIERLRDAS